MKFEIVCDSAADLSEEYAEEAGVTVVPFYVSLDGETYLKEGKEITVASLYENMAADESCFPKTSMPSIQDYVEAFTPIVKKGLPVLCICLTRKFSGSLESAMNAKMAVEEEYPEASIYVMDSELVTALQGLLVSEAVRLRDLGLDLYTAAEKLEGVRSTGQIFFTTKDLKYLEHGGRLNKAVSIAGSMLNLKPVLNFHDGELGSVEVVHGRKRSLQKIIDRFFEYLKAEDVDLSEYWFGTGLGRDVPEYEEFLKMVEDRFEKENVHPAGWVKIHIGATIGVHTGPYPMGLGILKKCEV